MRNYMTRQEVEKELEAAMLNYEVLLEDCAEEAELSFWESEINKLKSRMESLA